MFSGTGKVFKDEENALDRTTFSKFSKGHALHAFGLTPDLASRVKRATGALRRAVSTPASWSAWLDATWNVSTKCSATMKPRLLAASDAASAHLTCVTVPNFIKIGQTVTEIWQFNGFQNGGRPPFWIFEYKILTVGAVKRPILH